LAASTNFTLAVSSSLAVGGVGNGLVLHRAVHNHPRQFLGLDQLELDGDIDGLRQQFFHPFVAQQLAKLDQGGGVAGLAVFVVGATREELPTRCVAPALDHALIGFVESVFEVEQRNHDAQRHAGTPGVALAPHCDRRLTKQVQIGHGHASVRFAHEEVRNRGFDLLPWHARRQHSQRMAQVDHLVNAAAEEIVGGGAGEHRITPRNQRNSK
jgi:hypothetical protein